jgi:hypothetical protein
MTIVPLTGRLRSAPGDVRRCPACGQPVTTQQNVIEFGVRTFHVACLGNAVEAETYDRLYGDRSGNVGERRSA